MSIKNSKGFGIVEIIVAMSLFIVVAVSGVSTVVGTFSTNRLGEEETEANLYAQAGIDAVKSLKNQGWTAPFLSTTCTTGCGLGLTGANWSWSGTSNTSGKFSRVVTVSDVQRDVSGNIVSSGGTVDTNTKKITSVVSWLFSPLRNNSITLTTYLTNFRKSILALGGLLIYGDGTTTPKYRSYDSTANTFSTESSGAVGAIGQTYMIKSSPTKTEAIAGYVTNGGVLQIMCFDGSTWVNDWSVTVGGAGTTRRFDIAYETNSGDAIVLYSNNVGVTNEMAYRTKNGSSACGSANWSAATNLDPIRTTGTVQWVKMAWDRRASSNLITAIWADSASDLSAMVWSGTAWGNEPSNITETSLEIIAVAQDVEDFDVEYESLSGNVMIVWANSSGGNGTNGVRYRVCTGGIPLCTWGGVTTPPTFSDDATNLDISANPNSDEIVFGSIGNGGSDLQIGYWSGTAWTNLQNADTSCNTPIAGSKLVATGWLVSGATSRSIVRYIDQGSNLIDWYVGNASSFVKQTDSSQSPAPNGARYIDLQMDPINKDQLMSLSSDSVNDLFAKRLEMTAVPAFTWTNADGAALELTLPQAVYGPYSFAYKRI